MWGIAWQIYLRVSIYLFLGVFSFAIFNICGLAKNNKTKKKMKVFGKKYSSYSLYSWYGDASMCWFSLYAFHESLMMITLESRDIDTL